MKKRKITISDVARDMRVSVTTVSFVLNGKAEGRVSPSVIRRITEYANKIGYRPNPKAKKNQHNAVKLYGVLVEDISNTLQSQLVFHLEELLQKLDGHTVIMSMNGDGARGEQLFRALERMPINGYVLMSFDNIAPSLKNQVEANIPIVLFDCDTVDERIAAVKPPYGLLLKEVLIKYIAQNEPSRIGLVTCPSNAHRTTEFLNGYMQAMDAVNGDVLIKKIQQSSDNAIIQAQIRDFVRDNRLDTVVFSTDRLARLASEVIGEEPFAIRCIVSTADCLSFGGKEIQQLTLPLDVVTLAKDIVKGLLGD